MATSLANVTSFDPNKAVFEATRTLVGPVLTGSVTFDERFGGDANSPEYGRWIYVGATGTLSYVKYDGTTETLPNIVAGVWHPICAIQINSASTMDNDQLRWGS